MKKGWRNLLIFLAMFFVFIHTENNVQAADTYTDSGYTYTLKENEFGVEEATITGYTGSTYALAIPSEINGHTVVEIADRSFNDRSDLYSVSIPDTVTKIGESAFENDTNLAQVQLSRNLTYLGGSAFGICKNLASIEIPKSLDNTGTFNGGPFRECSSLENVTFEEGTAEITTNLFYRCDGLKEITIPETATRIELYAFKDCVNLKSIVVPESVTEIEDGAFEGCSNLTSADIGDGVLEIGDCAFENDIRLTDVKLPKNLTYLGGSAFGICKNLASIEIPKSLDNTGTFNGGPFRECSSLENVTFEEGTAEITTNLFYRCDGLKEITIPETATRIELYAFKDCVNLKSIVVPESVTEIEDGAFEGCSNLTSADIGDGVLEIGDCAFENDIRLTDVKLPKNLTYLGGSAFGICKNLSSIEIPKSLDETSTYNGGPFRECSSLKNVTFEEGTTEITTNLFNNCDGLKEITIPETVTRVELYAFKDCVNLKSIVIPDSVTEIGNGAFEGCSNMVSAEITDNAAENLGEGLFSKCSSLSSVKLPQTQDKITTNMFYGCSDLTEISLPETIERIEGSAFENAGLMTVELPEAVTYVGGSAYKGNEALEKVTVLDSPAEFGEKVFQGCVLLNDVSLGKQLKSLGRYAFYGCDALASVEVPDSATSIGDYCFAESDKLSEVKLGTGITAIPSYAFNLCPVLKSIVLPYRVAKINANAFTNCIQLTEITIPRQTTEIADNVFSYPSKMTIYGVAGTYAETYAKEKRIEFVAIDHPAETVSLDQTELRMLNGTSRKLVLSVEPVNFTDVVSWKSTDDSIVSVDANGSGEIKAKAVGTATIKVSVGRKSATCEVTVVQPVTSVSLNNRSLSLQALETFQLTASVYPNNAENKEIEWSSSDEDIASVDKNGFVTAHKKGKATITVKALDGSEKSAVCEVRVTNTAHEAESVEALESSHPYETNCTDYWTYTAPNTPDSIKVAFDTRTSTEKGFDYICIYDGEGNKVGRFTGDELSGKVITVPGDTVKIQLETDESADDESVEWGFRVASVTSGSEKLPQEFTGTTSYSKTYGEPAFALDCVLTAGDGELSYESDNEAVASVDTDGNVTINGAGTAQITVTAAATADYQRTQQTITIEIAKAKQELKLDYSVDTLYVGETLKLRVTSENGTPSFTSDQETVATVSPDGVVTGVAPGTVNITALLAGDKNHEEAKEIASLTVLAVPEGSVSLTKCKVALASSAFVFDGKEKTPKVIVSYNGTTLAEDTDYTLSYRNNVQPGTAYVIVKAVDGSEYYGVVEKEFTIKPKLPEDAKTIEPYAFSDCDDIYEANIGETVTEIGDGAFAGCDNLKDIYFSGNAPKMGEGVFEGVTATAYYPADDSTWTLDVLESYGGNITWKAWDPATGEVTKRSLSVCTASLEATEYVYDGEPKTPAVTVMDGKVLLEEDTDYTVNYSDNTEPGAATVTVQGAGEYGGTIVLNFTIRKLIPTLRFGTAAVSRTYGDAPFKNPLSEIETDGTISYTSGNVNVATVDGSGTVTIRGAGTTQITALASAGESYEGGSASYTLTVAKAANTITVGDIAKTWSKKQQSFTIGATAAGGARLSYSSNNKSLPVNAAGVVKKYIGSAVVTIQAAATANYNAAAKTITVSVNPKGTTVRKVKNNGSKRATVTWKKNTNVKGYQIQYSTDKSFASGAKAKNVSGNKKVSLTLKKLKKGQTYYVRIRTWTKVEGKKYYSAWSKAKSVKIRK